jgi:fructose-bisphosphate aldolase class II
MVLHGGTRLAEAQFTDLISRGCAKVNISTALKIAFVDAHREYRESEPLV